MIVEAKGRDTILRVIVQPKHSKALICGIQGDALKIKVTSPPEKGAANRECIEILSRALGLPKRSIELIQGASSRKKRFRIAAPAERVKEALDKILRTP